MTEVIEITVNGKTKTTNPGTTVAGLLGQLDLDRARVAVERNREIVPKTTYEAVVLHAGDSLEIVTFVGGG